MRNISLSNSKILVASFLIVLVASFIFQGQMNSASADSSDKSKNKEKKVRVLANSESRAAEAIKKGCEKVRETKGLKALVCDIEVAETLGLREDIKLFATDTVADAQIGADSVQASGNSGEGRKIVVLDTGYNYDHVELSSSYLGGKDFVNDDNDPMDDNGHGSHVAGLITADGVKSVAKGVAPEAGIIAGKVLNAEGTGFFSDLVAAIYWAVDGPDGIPGNKDDFKADAINLSMGTAPPYVYKSTYCDDEMPEMTDAIKYAISKKVTVVVAAGNYGSQGVSFPGCISYALTVGAVDGDDKVASFSGRGKGVDLTAPGVDLISAWKGTAYATSDGTSMSAPVVSATIALIKHEHHYYGAAKVRNILIDTSVDLGKVGKDHSYGFGRIDAAAAAAL